MLCRCQGLRFPFRAYFVIPALLLWGQMTIDPEKKGSFLRGEVWHGGSSRSRLLQDAPHSCLGFFLPYFRCGVVRGSQVGIDGNRGTFGGHSCPPTLRRFADESSHAAGCVQVHNSFGSYVDSNLNM